MIAETPLSFGQSLNHFEATGTRCLLGEFLPSRALVVRDGRTRLVEDGLDVLGHDRGRAEELERAHAALARNAQRFTASANERILEER